MPEDESHSQPGRPRRRRWLRWFRPSRWRPQPGWRRRWLRRSAWTALALLVVLLGAWWTRGWWLVPWIEDTARAQLHERLGGRWALSIARLDSGGLLLDRLELLEAADDSAWRALRCRRIAVELQPSRLLGDPLQILAGLQVAGLEVELDADRPLLRPSTSDASATESTPAVDWSALLDRLHRLPTRIAIDGKIRCRFAGRELHTRLAVDGLARDWQLALRRLHLDDARFDDLVIRQQLQREATRFRLTGQAELPGFGRFDSTWHHAPADGWRGRVTGSNGTGELRLSRRPAGELQLSLTDWPLAGLQPWIGALPARLQPVIAHGRLDLSVQHDRETTATLHWRVDSAATEAAASRPVFFELDGAGSWSADGLRLERLHADPLTGALRLDGLHWRPADGLVALERCRLDGLQWRTGDHLDLDGHLLDGWLVLDLRNRGLLGSLDGLLRLSAAELGPAWRELQLDIELSGELRPPPPGSGSLQLEASCRGPLFWPDGRVDLRGEQLAWPDLPVVDGHLLATTGARRVELQEAVLQSTGWQLQLDRPARLSWQDDGSWQLSPLSIADRLFHIDANGSGDRVDEANVTVGRLPLRVLRLLHADLPEVDGGISGQLTIADQGRSLQAEGRLRQLVPVQGTSDDLPPLDADWSLQGDGDRCQTSLTLQTAELKVLQIDTTIEQSFHATPALLQALLTAPLQVEAAITACDLRWLAPWLPNLAYARGRLDGRVTVEGQVAAPVWHGAVELSDASVAMNGLPPATAVGADLRLDQQAIVIDRFDAELGRAPVHVSGRWSLDPAHEHALTVRSHRALLVNDADMRLRADTDLRLSGPPGAPVLSGRLGVTDLLYSAQIDPLTDRGGPPTADDPLVQLFSIQTEPWDALRFDLQISDGELDRPDGTFKNKKDTSGGGTKRNGDGLQIRTNLFSGTLHADLHLAGTGAVPEPSGTVTCRQGWFAVPVTGMTYDIRTMLVRFEPDTPFDPSIDATATSRKAGYEITMQLNGPLRDPRLQVSTSPSLDSKDALILATTGMTPAQINDDHGGAALSTALPYLGKKLKNAFFGPADPDAGPSFFDRFSLSLDEERSKEGLSTARIEFRLNQLWFLYAERDRFEDHNAGILRRWTIGAEPADEEEAAATETIPHHPIDWRPVRVDGDSLPIGTGRLLRQVRRERRAYDQSNGDLLHAADAAASMQGLLREAGYIRARIELDPRPDDDVLLFQATVGKRWHWGTVGVDGGPTALHDALAGLLAGHVAAGSVYSPGAEDQAVSQLLSQLRIAGYRDARATIDGPWFDDGTATVSARIELAAGPRYRIDAIELDGISRLPQKLQNQLRSQSEQELQTPWRRSTAVGLRARLEGTLKDAGYQHATIEMVLPQPLPPDVPLLYRIDAGPVVRIKAITIDGLQRTDTDIAEHLLGLEPGDVLEQDRLRHGLDRLRGVVGLYRLSTELQGAGRQPEEVALRVDAEEAPSRFVEAHLGYGSYEELRGGLRYRDTNLFGRGRGWDAGIEASMRSHELNVGFTDPVILGEHRVLSINGGYGFREERSFDRTRLFIQPAVNWQLDREHRLRLSYLAENQRPENIQPEAEIGEVDERIVIGRFDVTWTWDARDESWLPQRGHLLELGFGIADGSIGSELEYIEPRVLAGVVVPLLSRRRLNLACMVSGTVRKPIDGADDLPLTERLFLGGIRSVRSFDRDELGPIDDDGDPLGGLTSVYGQIELRGQIVGGLHGALFYDIGSVSREPWKVSEDYGYGIGAGIRYHLPVGPLRIDGAYTPGKEFAGNGYQINAAIGFTF